VKHRPKHIVEYVALRGIVATVSLLPYRVSLALGWTLAWITFHVVRWRAAEAQRRILQVFGPDMTAHEARRIAWRSMRNFFFCAIDMARIPRLTRAWIDTHIEWDGLDLAQTAATGGRGAILVSPHMGSWEMSIAAYNALGASTCIIVGEMKNRRVDAYVNRTRAQSGIEIIPRGGPALRRTVKLLKEGRTLAFTPDLRSRTPGVRTRFLGAEANLVPGMGMFAKMAGVPILSGVTTRIGWTRHHIRFFEPIHPDPALDRDEDIHRMTQQIMDRFDRAIRDQPDQYFWFNKRWVLDPYPDPVPAHDPTDPPPTADTSVIRGN
jgi:KDO2-lipid IV(A) lauroyltransferase